MDEYVYITLMIKIQFFFLLFPIDFEIIIQIGIYLKQDFKPLRPFAQLK